MGAISGRIHVLCEVVGREAMDDGARRDNRWTVPCYLQKNPHQARWVER